MCLEELPVFLVHKIHFSDGWWKPRAPTVVTALMYFKNTTLLFFILGLFNDVLILLDVYIKGTQWNPMDGGNNGAWRLQPYAYCFITLRRALINFSKPEDFVTAKKYRMIIATKIHVNEMIRRLEGNTEKVRPKRERR